MANTRADPDAQLGPLMARYRQLDTYYQGHLLGHLKAAVAAFETGLEIVEGMQAEERAKNRSAAPLRAIEGGKHG